MGMGKTGFCYRGAERLIYASSFLLLILLSFSAVVQIEGSQGHTPQCRIQKCTTDFVLLTSHLNAALDGFDTEFCKALRAYSACTQRTAKSCRGNLVFHSAVLGISDLMSQRNCSKDGPTSPTHPEMPVEPCNYHNRHLHQQGSWMGVGAGTVQPPTYLFCGLFGDPHLRTFKDHFQTCKVEGAWPLIDNNYLSVQVTNVPVVMGSSATATNKVTIIFKPYQECTDQKVYQAVTDDLPAAFVDGTISGGDGEIKSLWVIEKSPGNHVEIHAAYIGVTVIVRQLGRYLTLAARVPEEMAMAFDETQDLQLCVNGCPTSERIDRDGHLPLPLQQSQAGMRHQQHHHHHSHNHNHNHHHQQQQQQQQQYQLPKPNAQRAAYSLEAAMAKCSEQLEVKDIYFHSCVFDLLTTGDANFTMAAYDALRDVKALHPRKERWHIYPPSGAVRGQVPPLPLLVFLCSLLTALLW
ncbi:RGM domain family member B [Clupea harengus]|uniref:RGM domain family member B n=1 Tax=Clupea harengus TaxID=7950 RepID=A0A8M1KH75_CLUHA|nr:RGM domain family member B [Clupea harengus]